MKTCRDCKYAIFQDYGYSNWTVEGTTMTCALDAHPAGKKEPIEVTFDDDKTLQYAAECPKFEEGDSIEMDVEGEGISELTPEQKKIWEDAGR